MYISIDTSRPTPHFERTVVDGRVEWVELAERAGWSQGVDWTDWIEWAERAEREHSVTKAALAECKELLQAKTKQNEELLHDNVWKDATRRKFTMLYYKTWSRCEELAIKCRYLTGKCSKLQEAHKMLLQEVLDLRSRAVQMESPRSVCY